MCVQFAALTAISAVATMPAMAAHEVKTRRFTRLEYERLIHLGIFRPVEPIELLAGELIVSEPQGAAHYTAIAKTARALGSVFGAGRVVRTQGPIGLDDDSEPEPDVAVVPGNLEDYRSTHPSTAALAVESRASTSTGSERAVSMRGQLSRITGWST
jgi:hypothetical protein